jgi:hypothetical protein
MSPVEKPSPYMESAASPQIREFSPEWFDASSDAWRSNKVRRGESWVYRCRETRCKRVVGATDYCIQHIVAAEGRQSIAERVVARSLERSAALQHSQYVQSRAREPAPLVADDAPRRSARQASAHARSRGRAAAGTD